MYYGIVRIANDRKIINHLFDGLAAYTRTFCSLFVFLLTPTGLGQILRDSQNIRAYFMLNHRIGCIYETKLYQPHDDGSIRKMSTYHFQISFNLVKRKKHSNNVMTDERMSLTAIIVKF